MTSCGNKAPTNFANQMPATRPNIVVMKVHTKSVGELSAANLQPTAKPMLVVTATGMVTAATGMVMVTAMVMATVTVTGMAATGMAMVAVVTGMATAVVVAASNRSTRKQL